MWQSGHLRWEQKRWWPHGTSANRASRGAFKHTSQTVYWVNLLRLSFKTPKKSSLLSSPLCSSNVWVSFHTMRSVNTVRNIFLKSSLSILFRLPRFPLPRFQRLPPSNVVGLMRTCSLCALDNPALQVPVSIPLTARLVDWKCGKWKWRTMEIVKGENARH